MAKATTAELKEIVEMMCSTFKFERIVWTIVCVMSAIAFLVLVIILISRNFDNINYVWGTVASAGGTIFSSGRFLKMWDDIMKLVTNNYNSVSDEK